MDGITDSSIKHNKFYTFKKKKTNEESTQFLYKTIVSYNFKLNM